MHQQYAAFAIELINRADVKGGDAENVAATKQWLRQIQTEQLVVGAPIAEKSDPTPPEPVK